ncbi:MAG: 16S rRNA processing protein RimM [Ruminococcaceae bacterium]|nr:16S rRNA processing protein RimM [Oscillospiraceae bacterium]
MARITYPECGKIINTHGCHGGVKLEPWCDSPAIFTALPVVYLRENGALRPLKIKSAAVLSGRFVCAELEGVDSMEAAQALRGQVLYADRNDLRIPEGALLIAEMKGMKVYHAVTGAQLGVLSDVIHPGATDIYVIRTEKGEAMVPVVPAFVQRVDENEGIFLTPIEGMFD